MILLLLKLSLVLPEQVRLVPGLPREQLTLLIHQLFFLPAVWAIIILAFVDTVP